MLDHQCVKLPIATRKPDCVRHSWRNVLTIFQQCLLLADKIILLKNLESNLLIRISQLKPFCWSSFLERLDHHANNATIQEGSPRLREDKETVFFGAEDSSWEQYKSINWKQSIAIDQLSFFWCACWEINYHMFDNLEWLHGCRYLAGP